MSDVLSAAAQALGAPEAIVQRSAEARAKATGQTPDAVLQAWAGGESVAAAPAEAPAPTEAPAEPAPEPEAAPTPEPPAPAEAPAPTEAPAAAEAPAAVAVAARPAAPPILEGRHERPFAVMLGAVGLFLVTILAGFAAPAVPEEGNGVYTSAVPLSEAGQAGRDLYRSEGCAACHTQMVRTIVADAGLGGVTTGDSNQVLGTRRYGPDLAHIGSRVESDGDLYSVLNGGGGHPSYAHLDDVQLDRLVSYLLESR